MQLKKDIEDKGECLGEGNKVYTVRFAYNRIRDEMREDDDKFFYRLWTAKAVRLVQFCVWRVLLTSYQ